jgi:hypothetical protein
LRQYKSRSRIAQKDKVGIKWDTELS